MNKQQTKQIEALVSAQVKPESWVKEKKNAEFVRTALFWSDSRVQEFVLAIPRGRVLQDLIQGWANQESWDPGLIAHFISEEPEYTFEKIRFYKWFLNADFLHSLEEASFGQTKDLVVTALNEFKRLCEKNKQIDKETRESLLCLAKLDWEDFMCLSAIWLEYKYLQADSRPQGHIVGWRQTFYKALTQLVELKGQDTVPDWEDPILLQDRFRQVLDQCRKPDYWDKIAGCFDQIHSTFLWEDLLDGYAYHGFHLVDWENGGFEILPTPEEEERWQRIGAQYPLLERYFDELGYQSLRPEQRGVPGLSNPLDPGDQMRWSLLAMPGTFTLNSKEFKPTEVLLFLTAINSFPRDGYLSSFEEAILQDEQSDCRYAVLTAIKQSIDKDYSWNRPLMGPIIFTTPDHLVKSILNKTSFSQEIDETALESVIEFLALDVKKISAKQSIRGEEYPFLRFGKLVCYFSRTLSLHSPAYILQNHMFRLAQANDKKQRDSSQVNTLSDLFEEMIRDWLVQAGFHCTSRGVPIKENSKTLTDIDVLAWKGNEVLVIQAKNTYARLHAKNIEEYYEKLDKAGEQLDISLGYIKKNPEDFLREHNIGIKPSRLVVHGLVVAATPEGNYRRYGQGQFLKISSDEMYILLTNTREFLIDQDLEALALDLGSRAAAKKALGTLRLPGKEEDLLVAIGAARLRNEEALMELIHQSCDTWAGKEPSIQRLMDLIEKDWLWQNLIDVSLPDYLSSHAGESEKKAYLALRIEELQSRSNPTEADLLELSDLFLFMNEPVQALKIINKVLDHNPNQINALHARGSFKLAQEMDMPALKDFQQIIDIDPLHKEAWAHVADILARQGQMREAEAAYLESVRIDPSFSLGWFNYGVFLLRQVRVEEAINCFQKVTTDKACGSLAWHNIGFAFETTGRLEEALQAYRTAVLLRNDSAFMDWAKLASKISNNPATNSQ